MWRTYGTLTTKYPTANLIVTGWSLGAALSTVCAADLIRNGINGFRWYSFGR